MAMYMGCNAGGKKYEVYMKEGSEEEKSSGSQNLYYEQSKSHPLWRKKKRQIQQHLPHLILRNLVHSAQRLQPNPITQILRFATLSLAPNTGCIHRNLYQSRDSRSNSRRCRGCGSHQVDTKELRWLIQAYRRHRWLA